MTKRKVVLISGASSGIGRACAARLAQRGHIVYGTTRQNTAQASSPEGVRMLSMNVNDEQSVAAAVEEVLRQSGRVDVAVNNAGFGIAGAVEETSPEEARNLLETNLLGVLRVCRQVLPEMRTQSQGIIVNISSLAGRVGLPFQGMYSATKFALEGLSEALRMEVRGFGIRVVVIAPGDFSTEFTTNRRMIVAGPESAYREPLQRALNRAEADERGGTHPEQLARLLQRVVEGRGRKNWYSCGALSQRLAVGLRPYIPRGMYERGMMRHYRV